MQTFSSILAHIPTIPSLPSHIKSDVAKFLSRYENKISDTLAVLSDYDSKVQFCRELIFCAISFSMPEFEASSKADLMPQNEWQNHLQNFSSSSLYGKIVVSPYNEIILPYCLTTTCLLEQYRYKEKVFIKNGDICLYLGACLGDTSLYFCENGASHIYAFEIDKNNIETMKSTLKLNNKEQAITIVEKAVSSRDEILYYIPGDHAGSGRIQSECFDIPAAYPIQSISIDAFCKENAIKPNFIKMDIEGAELDAIEGAVNVLQTFRPRFAICVYHNFTHRFLIPLRLKELLPDYKFFLKKSHPVWETVLFGTPE